MPVRNAEAEWKGDLQNGQGQLKLGTGPLRASIRLRRAWAMIQAGPIPRS